VPKVNINGAYHQVTIEHDGDLDTAIRAARKLWKQTAPKPGGTAGPAFGFQPERRDTPNLYSTDADGITRPQY
jgi:hypothetical protein